MFARSGRIQRLAVIARISSLAAVAIALTGCVSMYVDNSLKEVPASDYQRPAHPRPVQLLFAFQTKGVANAKGTEILKQEAMNAVAASGLFESVSEGPVSGGALLSITLNNVPITSQGSAMAKGVMTGATLGLAGSEVSDGYVCTIEYLRAPGAPKSPRVCSMRFTAPSGQKARRPMAPKRLTQKPPSRR